MNTLQALSLSHQTAAVQYREALQFTDAEAAAFLQSLQEKSLVAGAVLVTTCNRTEVYFEAEGPSTAQVLEELLAFKNNGNPEVYLPLFQHFTQSQEAFRYLLEVGIGLRSQVLGDRQIIGQLKESYGRANDLKATSPLLHHAFQSLFKTHKRVHNETSFRAGASSVGYAALERVTDFFPRQSLAQKNLLIIGTGQLGTDVAKYAASFGFTHITLTNRSIEKAEALASTVNGQVLPFTEIEGQLERFEVMISCVSGGQIISLPTLQNLPQKKRVLLDLAVPLSIPAEAELIPGISLVNMDDITSRTQAVQKLRETSIADVQRIIEEDLQEFEAWLQDLPVAHTLQELKRLLAHVVETEVQHRINNSGATAPSPALASTTLNQLLRRPAGILKSTQGSDRKLLLESLQTLFQLS
ncbi:glutamyl-tRNA reductase [Rufibacter immobilis]|uniref:glutamyl-tRNA reductase n=1 Tax=Rufibacter immobilis TaxID=1348778 RepID=UPI0035EAE885